MILFISTSFADSNKTFEINAKDKTWLEQFGFTETYINHMTELEFEDFKEEYGHVDPKIVNQVDEYYKVNGNGATKVSKETALEQSEIGNSKDLLNNSNVSILAGDNDSYNDGWIKTTLVGIEMSGGKYLAMYLYEWLRTPTVGFQDTIAITHGDNVDVNHDTFFSHHGYSDTTGDHYEADEKPEKSNFYGVADKFNLKWYTNGESLSLPFGYMRFEFERDKTSDNTGELYGHYLHALTPFGYSISLGYKGVSLSGTTESHATDLVIEITY